MIFQPPSSLASVTDAIAAANTLVLGLAPVQAMATTYMHAALSGGLAAYNAVNGQHQQQAINAAAHVRGLMAILGRRRRR